MDASARGALNALRASQERERLSKMDEESADANRARRTVQENERLSRMTAEAAANLRERRTKQEHDRVSAMNSAVRNAFNERNAANQRNYRYRLPADVNQEYAAYLADLSENKMPLEDHPFVQQQQQAFHDAMNRYQMRHCIICRERWPTVNDLHVAEANVIV